MDKKKLVPMLGALIVFLIALMNPLESKNKNAEETVEVLVAFTDILEKGTLNKENVEVKNIAKSAVPSNAVLSLEEIEGKMAISKIYKDDIITSNKFAEKGNDALGLSSSVEDGMRALTINVDVDTGLNGLLQIGDRIDILTVVAENDTAISKVLLENKEVIALNTRINNQNKDKDITVEGDMYTTVTILVTKQEALQIALSDVIAAKNRIILRNRYDDKANDAVNFNMQELIN